MPSLHMAWAVWCGVTVYRLSAHRSVRVAAIAYPALTAFVVIGTANHYLFDVLAGIALWWLADRAVATLAAGGRRAQSRTEDAAGSAPDAITTPAGGAGTQ
jgi:hypothetical protein